MGLLMFSSSSNKPVACDGANESYSSVAEWGKFPGSNNNGNFGGGDKMDVKTTVVSVTVDGGTTEKVAATERQGQLGCDPSRVVHTAIVAGVLIAFAVVLALYVRELQTSHLVPTAPETCFEDECISRAAGKLRYRMWCYIYLYIYIYLWAVHLRETSFSLSLWCVWFTDESQRKGRIATFRSESRTRILAAYSHAIVHARMTIERKQLVCTWTFIYESFLRTIGSSSFFSHRKQERSERRTRIIEQQMTNREWWTMIMTHRRSKNNHVWKSWENILA